MKSIELDGSMLKNLKPRESASHKGTYERELKAFSKVENELVDLVEIIA